MGQFSWLDCCNQRPIVDNRKKDVFVLVPKEFQDTYGERIKEGHYNGYGNFGGHDVYELVALWNRDHTGIEDIEVPSKNQYAEEKYYNQAMKCYEKNCERLKDFCEKKLTFEEMQKKYGDEFLREIGIDIACYDEQNAKMEYPIKITYNKDAVYEACPPSPGDPEQGWSYFSEAIFRTEAGAEVEEMIDRISEARDMDYYDVKDAFSEIMLDMEDGKVEKTPEAIERAFDLKELVLSYTETRDIISLYDEMTQYDESYSRIPEMEEREV